MPGLHDAHRRHPLGLGRPQDRRAGARNRNAGAREADNRAARVAGAVLGPGPPDKAAINMPWYARPSNADPAPLTTHIIPSTPPPTGRPAARERASPILPTRPPPPPPQ